MYAQKNYMVMRETINPMSGLGQNPLLDAAISTLTPYAQQLGTVAATKIQPVIRQEIESNLPRFAAITGLVSGALVIAGLIMGKKLLK